MNDACPPFLAPRLRLFLSADIVGSTSLKQSRAKPGDSVEASLKGPDWFSAIQGFYFEAAQSFLSEWSHRKTVSKQAGELYGEEPKFWKSIGDEVLFTKLLTDHRQVVTTLSCWHAAVGKMRLFLKNEKSTLDVKCTAWVAGFPYRNREVAIDRSRVRSQDKVHNYYKESGRLLNSYYQSTENATILVDYIGPSIDTGFRLTSHSTARKMAISVDLAYLISMTNFDGEVKRLDIHYDGSTSLKGVIGGAPYPLFWLNMSSSESLAIKEDRLKSHASANREDVKEYCDAFYNEYQDFTFRPFIKDDIGQTLALTPEWYEGYHQSLVKNFNLPDSDEMLEPIIAEDVPAEVEDPDAEEVLRGIGVRESARNGQSSNIIGSYVRHEKFGVGIITEIEQNVLTVDFKSVGRKRVLSAFLRST